jgi:hypothetical protein
MSNLRVPLNGTREIHAQAVAQANVEKYRAHADAQPTAAQPVSEVAQDAAFAPVEAAKDSASQWSVQAVVPPRTSDNRGPQPLFGETQPGKDAPHFSSTKQGTGPDQPRVVAIVPHVSRPPMPPRNGTMRIWAAVTTPSPAENTLQNVKRVIQQSAKNDASVVMLAPPAVISDRPQQPRAAGHR